MAPKEDKHQEVTDFIASRLGSNIIAVAAVISVVLGLAALFGVFR